MPPKLRLPMLNGARYCQTCALGCLDKAVLAEGQVCSSVEVADTGKYKLHHRLHFELFDIGPLWFMGEVCPDN